MNEQTILERAEEKLKQLNEAVSLLDDIGFKVSWALDFSKFNSINDILNPISYQLSDAQSEMEYLVEQMEEEIETYKKDKKNSEKEFDSECSLAYNLA